MKRAFLYDDYYFTEYRHNYFRQGNNGQRALYNFIAYMKKGRVKLKSADKVIEVQEGEMFYIPKGMKYYSYWYGEPEINFVSLGFMNYNVNRETEFDLQKIAATPALVEKIKGIPLVRAGVDFRTLALFYDALADIVPLLEVLPDRRDNSRVEKIKLAISNSPQSSMSQIAAECNISEPYMYSLFKEISGTTPNAFRQSVLCDMARELLVTTDMSVERISESLGFSSSSYFRRVFKKFLGKCPREIRKNVF